MKKVKEKKWTELIFIATHNSCSYKLHNPLQGYLKPFVLCQEWSIAEQLERGVRVLDIRVCTKKNIAYTAHSFLLVPLDEIVNQINQFIASHPSEFVILLLKEDYPFRESIDWDLIRVQVSRISSCHSSIPSDELTVSQVIQKGQVIIYSEKLYHNNTIDRWYNVESVEELLVKANQDFASSPIGLLYIPLFITPSPRMIAAGYTFGLPYLNQTVTERKKWTKSLHHLSNQIEPTLLKATQEANLKPGMIIALNYPSHDMMTYVLKMMNNT